jgi:transposase
MEVRSHHTLEQLQLVQREQRDVAHWKRLQIVILAKRAWTAPAIAAAVGLSRRIVQAWVYSYNQFSLSGLEDGRGAAPRPLLEPEQERQFRQRVESGPRPEDRVCSLRGRDFQRILREEFGVWRSLAATYRWLHHWNYSCLRPRPRHRYADPQKQQAFIQTLPVRMDQIAEQQPGKTLRLMFQDEARFGQPGTTTTVWARTGSRPTAVRQTEYQYVWVMGVVCPETGFAEGLLCPRLDARYVNVFLRQLSERIPPDEHVVMLWDGASFHRSGQVRMPQNITAIQLPAYSPELNPIENLWHYLKSHYWSNRVYEDAEDLDQTAIDAWRDAVLQPDLMKTVCSAAIYKRASSS